MHRIVVWDPTGELREGSIVSGAKGLGVLHGRGVETLPAEPDLISQHAIGGYFRRAWGDGWVFDKVAATRGCPMILRAVPDRIFLHWVARVEPIRAGEAMSGTLRLTTATNLIGTATGGLMVDSHPDPLGELDERGGRTIRGRSRINVTEAGYVGLTLYGAVNNASVAWSAVSQSSQQE